MNKNICIIIDSREKKNQHITKYLDNNNIKYKIKKLESGDYSFEYNDISYEEKFSIERKASIDELCNNLTRKREQFNNEFSRALKNNTMMFLLIENSNFYSDVTKHNYRSKTHPNAVLGSLRSFKEKYNIYCIFSKREKTGCKIINIFERYIKNFLEVQKNEYKIK